MRNDALEEAAKQGNRQRSVPFRLVVAGKRFWRLALGERGGVLLEWLVVRKRFDVSFMVNG